MVDKVDQLEIFIQGDEVKSIKIKKFSFIKQCQMEYAYFQPKRAYYPRLFRVKIYPVGLQEKSKDYISIEIFKCLKDADPLERHAYDIITWTFSIIDIKGTGRYYQSFTKENIVHFPYKIGIPHFMKRSSILEQADEFLAADVLTVLCEATFLSYPGPAVEKYLHLRNWKFEERIPHNSKEKRKAIENSVTDYETFIEKAEKNLINDMCYFLSTLHAFREENLEPKSIEFWRNTLVDDFAADALSRTYMHLNPYFQTYQLLKKKLLEVLEVFPNYTNIEGLDLEFHKPWCEIKLELIEKLKMQREKFVEKYGIFPLNNFCRKIDLDLLNKDHPSFESEEEIDRWKIFINAIEYELENNREYNILDQNKKNEDEWNFIVETKDGLTFTLPFKKNHETIGSKLISNSCIFKNMLETPMKEKVNKRVKLTDVDSATFINILKYLQNLEIGHNFLPQISNLYEVADQYELKDLMQLCANWMRPLLTPENVDEVELLAYLHSDDYLNQFVDAYKTQIMDTNTFIAEFNSIHYKEDLDFYS